MREKTIQVLLEQRKLDTDYIDSQNLISKLNLLELLQKYEPYNCLDSNYESNYYRRIEKSLSYIPEKYQVAALTLFANAFYIGESLLSDSLVYLFKEVENQLPDKSKLSDSVHFFEVDPSGMIESFFRVNKIGGRLDTGSFSRIKSSGELINALSNYVSCENLPNKDTLIESIKGVLSKENWVVLTDFSFSGTSLISDIQKLLQLRSLCFEKNEPKIFVCAQIISTKVLSRFKKELDKQNIQILYAQCYGDDLRIVPDMVWNNESITKPECQLFEGNDEVYKKVTELCEWFAITYINRDPDHQKTADQSDLKTLAFGYKECGFTVIPQRNAPSNSLPIFWYTPSNRYLALKDSKNYVPPFPRTVSRITQTTAGDGELLKNLISKKTELSKILNEIKS